MTAQCVHHFVIASPEPGRKELPGVCRYCGAERMFRATVEESYREDFTLKRSEPLYLLRLGVRL